MTFFFFLLQMCKLVVLLFIVTLTYVYAQKLEKQTNKTDEQSLAAKSTDIAETKTAQTGNPNAKKVVQAPVKPKPKPKPKPRRRPPTKRRRRPRRRKRPRNRQRRPRPTARTGKQKQNQKLRKTPNRVTNINAKNKAISKQNAVPKTNKETQSKGTNQQKSNIKTELKQNLKTSKPGEVKHGKSEIIAEQEIKPKQEIFAGQEIQPTQEIKEAAKQPAIEAKLKLEPKARVQPLKQTQPKSDTNSKPKTVQNIGNKKHTTNNKQTLEAKPKKELEPRRDNKPMLNKKPKVDNKPIVDNSFHEQDGFFDFFTTTSAEDLFKPPPDFDPNQKPGEKVLPEVDASKAIAYDGTRKYLIWHKGFRLWFSFPYVIHMFLQMSCSS